ncbi:hypothetical protein IV38_GL001325 [Lactobacillus selangorensis]|uniref:DUF3284 domain-containing protein n=1 Tax=Lactobacillus selangorensis TaxID=81857 RepID=A0A0R2G076_9LACO|nr:DUF3284 domain-containing protein [Lactobacillus selangorensis]KRN28327.1 hypothetical protein IV38_GL001325 [Lactobacillus selangorensis]KRN31829.1 hypothetical protein IV40_GL001112 [Lactobacillus selangorensis]
MKVTKTLDVPADFFYKRVIDSVLFDIRKQTGKTVPVAALKGFKYRKDFGNGNSADIEITQAIQNQSYHYKTVSNRNTYEASYNIFPIDDKSIKVVYSEHVKAANSMQRTNDIIVQMLLGFLRKRNCKKMLSQIAASY